MAAVLDGDSVDELRQAAALTGADALAAALAGHGRAIEVVVSGRPGVGKSAVVALLDPSLGPVVERQGVDSPEHPEPDLTDVDVLVHVISGAPHPCDRAAVAGRPPTTTVVAVARSDLYARPPDLPEVATVAVPTDPNGLDAAVRRARIRVELDRARAVIDLARAEAAARPGVRDAVETFLRHPATSAVRAAC